MKNVSSESFWSSLETPLPNSVAFVPNASVEVGQLQKENQYLTIAIVALGMIAGGVIIYSLIESKSKELQRRIV
jgi:hypothetical protein